jgi:cobyrinic acid a,c-diamide synthase
VGSETHLRWVREAIESTTGLPVVGHLPRREDLVLPERHLGLIPTAEGRVQDDFFDRLVAQIERTVDLDTVQRLAETAPPLPEAESGLFPPTPVPAKVRLALARDEAFSFYYEDSLDLLTAWGAEIVPFSPLHDQGLPEGAAGVYLGGGFPELFAGPLAENRPMHKALRTAARGGMPIYGECGGLMYLLESITDMEGRPYPMVGLVPGQAAMVGRRLKLAYVTALARQSSPLLAAGDAARGHEFHWSELRADWPAERLAYDLVDRDGRREGYASGNLLASYIHLHFGANPRLAPRLVETCAQWAEEAVQCR